MPRNTKKAASKKATPKKATPKKATPKKAASKKATASRVTAKKATPKKATPKKAAASRVTAKKTTTKVVREKVSPEKKPFEVVVDTTKPRKTSKKRVLVGIEKTTESHVNPWKVPRPDKAVIKDVCEELIGIQKERASMLKICNKIHNACAAQVMNRLGYYVDMPEDERGQMRKRADACIAAIDKGNPPPFELTSNTVAMILDTQSTRDNLTNRVKELGDVMGDQIKRLPHLDAWLQHPDRRGIGRVIAGVILGESGDLCRYETVSRFWSRLVSYPYQKNGLTQMPSTWRRWGSGTEPKFSLTSKEWEDIGYSPRRNSTLYVLRTNIVKSNQDGPYRQKYDMAKAIAAQSHPDWRPARLHAHAQLVAAKLFLKHMWLFWWGDDVPTLAYEDRGKDYKNPAPYQDPPSQ